MSHFRALKWPFKVYFSHFRALQWSKLSVFIEFTVSNLPYRIYRSYRFKIDLSNRFYRGSINQLSITVPNGKGHLSISAGACFLGVCYYRSNNFLSSLQKIVFIPFRLVLIFWRLLKNGERKRAFSMVIS